MYNTISVYTYTTFYRDTASFGVISYSWWTSVENTRHLKLNSEREKKKAVKINSAAKSIHLHKNTSVQKETISTKLDLHSQKH